jgi:DNA-binding transcriptional MerR regulator
MTPADDPGQAAGNGDPDELLAVGDLARATGLTVRTLHHYDRLGLLSALRDAGGRRRYGPAEARRLHQIIALRGFGLPLAEIAWLLEGQGPDPLLRHSLLAVISGLTSHDGEVTAFQLVELIERMITVDRKLTREQLDQLIEERRQLTARLTPAELAQLQKQREEQVRKLTPAQLAGLQQRRQQLLPADFPGPGAG